jgi:hypothetical protein
MKNWDDKRKNLDNLYSSISYNMLLKIYSKFNMGNEQLNDMIEFF